MHRLQIYVSNLLIEIIWDRDISCIVTNALRGQVSVLEIVFVGQCEMFVCL